MMGTKKHSKICLNWREGIPKTIPRNPQIWLVISRESISPVNHDGCPRHQAAAASRPEVFLSLRGSQTLRTWRRHGPRNKNECTSPRRKNRFCWPLGHDQVCWLADAWHWETGGKILWPGEGRKHAAGGGVSCSVKWRHLILGNQGLFTGIHRRLVCWHLDAA